MTRAQSNVTTNGISPLLAQNSLRVAGNAVYGNDTVALSYVGSGTPALDGQNVAGIATKDLFMGLFGVNPAATNFSSSGARFPSYMTSLKAQEQIPSLSYGYTAGNKYRFNTVLASLTLGGYDASLFVPNNLTFPMGTNSGSELTVDVKGITMSSQEGGIRRLDAASFSAVIDSTVPYLYLPTEVCRRFEDAFGLKYDERSSLYLVNNTLHNRLIEQSANVTFTLSNTRNATGVNIVLPYAAFDLRASWPLVQNQTRYFPLKRAAQSSQVVLGRAFLQEA